MADTDLTTLLVIGGARSGKSRHAQACAEQTGKRRVYIATAQAGDDEMAARIARHRADRGPEWHTVEAPLALPEAIGAAVAADRVVLVDCLTLWASNLLLAGHDIEGETGRLLSAMARAAGPLILVTNEVGLGIVPDNALARRFRDVAGEINQRVAAAAREVVALHAGLPLRLK